MPKASCVILRWFRAPHYRLDEPSDDDRSIREADLKRLIGTKEEMSKSILGKQLRANVSQRGRSKQLPSYSEPELKLLERYTGVDRADPGFHLAAGALTTVLGAPIDLKRTQSNPPPDV